MAAIGAFLGWQATFFSLDGQLDDRFAGGITLIVCGRREWSSRLPYGPYIAVAAAIWVFLPFDTREDVRYYMVTLVRMFTGSGGTGY